ncbi:expressed protein [Chlorella variabilis]|uniref:Expressed protein n=1 Tax=Chlorella variabilis TaxID=554065 RepID=E1Z5X6_CHLVA|nr:expressed protein [Chlorella variabilis]EFN58831.1 expressed protein [Chlorella variabilis]|eukprot:XP_005850933.1 expressed protein [Chlorella variabilis]
MRQRLGAPAHALDAGTAGAPLRTAQGCWALVRDACGSPGDGASLDSGAGLAPTAAAPLAPPLVTLTDSASAGSGSPGGTPTSPQHRQQQPRQPHQGPVLPPQKRKLTGSGGAVPAQPPAAARRSKRKAPGEALWRPPRTHAPPQPATSVGDSPHGHGTAHAQQQHHHTFAGLLTGPAAAAAGPATLPLDLPGLGDLDDVPGLDDLLLGMTDEDPLLAGDLFAGTMPSLASPWSGGDADPFAQPPPEQQQARQQELAFQQQPQQLALPPGQPALNPFAGQERVRGAAMAAAAAPAAVMVPQPGPHLAVEAARALRRVGSANTVRSHTSLDRLPAAAGARKAAGGRKSGGGASSGRSVRREAPPAAGARQRVAPAAGPAAALQRQHAQQQTRRGLASPSALVASTPSASLGEHRAAVGPVPRAQPAAARLPLVIQQQQERHLQQQRVVPMPRPVPPAAQWLSRDPSQARPVHRAAAPPKPTPTPLDPAQLRLSAAATLVAAAAPLAPPTPGAAHAGSADLRLLQCVFGEHFPQRWRW